MKFLKIKRTYESSYNIEEFRTHVQGQLNEKKLFGLLRNHGKLTSTEFEIRGFNYTRLGGPNPRMCGTYKANKNKTLIELIIYPSDMVYIMEGFALILISFLVFNPNTKINGEPSELHMRVLFGLIFMLTWTGALALLSYFSFHHSNKKIIKEFDMKRVF